MTMWKIIEGNTPLVATAIHNGHRVRPEIAELMAISEADRLREEDPFTGIWTDIAETRVIANFSRFQVDLNRPRDRAVYITPEDAWGLEIWKKEPDHAIVERSLQEYDRFYAEMNKLLSRCIDQFGRAVVLDLHTYNHCRMGPEHPPAEAAENPEVNVGTGSLNRLLWAPVVPRDTLNYP